MGMSLGLSIGLTSSTLKKGVGYVPPGFVLLKGADGAYLKGADGAYLYGVAP
jgi:hypothetical protein